MEIRGGNKVSKQNTFTFTISNLQTGENLGDHIFFGNSSEDAFITAVCWSETKYGCECHAKEKEQENADNQ